MDERTDSSCERERILAIGRVVVLRNAAMDVFLFDGLQVEEKAPHKDACQPANDVSKSDKRGTMRKSYGSVKLVT